MGGEVLRRRGKKVEMEERAVGEGEEGKGSWRRKKRGGGYRDMVRVVDREKGRGGREKAM